MSLLSIYKRSLLRWKQIAISPDRDNHWRWNIGTLTWHEMADRPVCEKSTEWWNEWIDSTFIYENLKKALDDKDHIITCNRCMKRLKAAFEFHEENLK